MTDGRSTSSSVVSADYYSKSIFSELFCFSEECSDCYIFRCGKDSLYFEKIAGGGVSFLTYRSHTRSFEMRLI